jgi:3-hydroxymyristoyl/3-hydroxydecanoyl-(acyl carrier protein) dehydratase/NAD(P)-dependent dehydrogenase (short-subunit alcohol dehydrogenase family)
MDGRVAVRVLANHCLGSGAVSLFATTTFLVSGGARGITARCVIELAHHSGGYFVLLGRSAYLAADPAWALGASSPDSLKQRAIDELQATGRVHLAEVRRMVDSVLAHREIDQTLQSIVQAGGQAKYVQVDITDKDALCQAITPYVQHSSNSLGIIHGAGVLSDRLIQDKTISDFEHVYHPKITGLYNLLSCLPSERLNYLVLFSSIAGFLGNVGQTDYALVNAMLDTVAYSMQRDYPHCRVLSINWGPWDSGMVSDDLRALFAEHDVRVISSDQGAKQFVTLLTEANRETQILVGSPINTTYEPLGWLLRMVQERRALMSRQRNRNNPGVPTSYAGNVRRHLSMEANPFLRDHVIHGAAVLPATFALAWLSAICEQQYPGYTFVRCDDFEVLKGIVFDDTLADQYIVELEPTVNITEQTIICVVLIKSESATGSVRYHYRGRVTLSIAPSPTLLETFTPPSAVEAQDGTQFYQDGTLFHGPYFRGIEQVWPSDKGLVLQCRLPAVPARAQGQFPVQSLNPYVLDAAIQSMGIWARFQHASSGMPTGIRQVEQFCNIPFQSTFYITLTVQSHTAYFLTVNMNIYDAAGHPCVRMSGVEGTFNEHMGQQFGFANYATDSRSELVLDSAAVQEFTYGRIEPVFGSTYAHIDAYPARVRLPQHDYLLIDRVAHLQGTSGQFKDGQIITEYDIPVNAWYSVMGQVPMAIATEAGHGILILISYLGVDDLSQGQRYYRQLDSDRFFFAPLPTEGQTLRHHIQLEQLEHTSDCILIHYNYTCFVDNRPLCRMEHGRGGLFTHAELQHGSGIVTRQQQTSFAAMPQPPISPRLCARTSLESEDLNLLVLGHLTACFGKDYGPDENNPALRLPPRKMLMLDRVVSIEPTGGKCGLGMLVGQKTVTPDDWYFAYHFKDDPVLPGSLLLEGGTQLLQIYMLCLGLHQHSQMARFQPLSGFIQRESYRSQVTPAYTLLTYHANIIQVVDGPHPHLIGEVSISQDNKTIANLYLGIQIMEVSDPEA